MRNPIALLLLFVSLWFMPACMDDDMPPPDNVANKILPLGASRVEGGWPLHVSYRYELWKDLIQSKWTFDLMGTREDVGIYPEVQGQHFDDDHEGRSGWTSGQILAGLPDWLEQTGSPDIVLFSSPGGNDALQNMDYDQAVQNVNDIIDILQDNNPNVTIIIEQMAPGNSYFMNVGQLSTYFEDMQQEVLEIAEAQTTATSRVIPVDMYTGFSDAYLADLVHYNEAGARFIAERYYDVLVEVME